MTKINWVSDFYQFWLNVLEGFWITGSNVQKDIPYLFNGKEE